MNRRQAARRGGLRRRQANVTVNGLDPVLAELLDLAASAANGRLVQGLHELRQYFGVIDDPLMREGYRAEVAKTLKALNVPGAARLADAVFDRSERRPDRHPLEASEDGSRRPRIDAGDLNLSRVAEQAWAAMVAANEPPAFFLVGDVPSRLEDSEASPVLRPLNQDRLRHRLARVADWICHTESGARAALPPLHVVRDMLAHPNPPLPPLLGIVGAPVFASDGHLIDKPGYHPTARLYYAPGPALEIPPVAEAPTADQIARAKALLLDELLVDFPFTGVAERAHALALLLLPFVREMIDGRTPLHRIEKPAPGTGAGLLVQLLARPALGHPPAVMTAGRDEDEWRKRITAKLISGSPFVVIDNLRGRLDSGALSAAITAPVWEDRLLGQTQLVSLPVRCVWVATGNNPGLSNEIARRTVRVRLDSKVDRPWTREGFKHENIREWASAHRGLLVWAALALIRAWLAEGRPAGRAVLGEFEAWARTIGGILDVAQVPGFLGNMNEFYELSDAEGAEDRRLLAAWWNKYRSSDVGARELIELALDDAVSLPLTGKSDRAQRTQLGLRLAGLRDRRYTLMTGEEEIIVLVAAAGKQHGAGRWSLLRVEPGREKVPLGSPRSPSEGGNGPDSGNLGNVGEPFTGGSGWRCACGAVNRAADRLCEICGQSPPAGGR